MLKWLFITFVDTFERKKVREYLNNSRWLLYWCERKELNRRLSDHKSACLLPRQPKIFPASFVLRLVVACCGRVVNSME